MTNTNAQFEPAAKRTAAFGVIFASAVASGVSIGIVVLILPNVLKLFLSGNTAIASKLNVAVAACGGLMSFVAARFWGFCRIASGRRPVLLLCLCGLGLDFVFMAFAPILGWLFVRRLISGATSGVFSTGNAYVADVRAPEERARAFGWMAAAFSVGFSLDP